MLHVYIGYILLQVAEKESILPQIAGIAGILIAVFAITFLVFFIFSRHQQNKLVLRQKAMQQEFEKQLVQAQVEMQEQTFGELGRELHDNVGQLLSSAKLLLGITERSLPDPPETLITAEDTLGKAVQNLRALSKSLNTEWLNQFNLIENLHVETGRINAANNVQLNIESNVTNIWLRPEQQIMLFRIIQEAIQNGLNHAAAKVINIIINASERNLHITIEDNGNGFDVLQQSPGVGIINMQHRVTLLKGNIKWNSVLGKGTNIEIELPL